MSTAASHPLAKTYAKALFGAVPAAERESVLQQLQSLSSVWPLLSDALLSPMVPASAKKKLWDSVKSQKHVQGILKVLDAHKRLRLLPAVALRFEQLTLEAQGRVKIRLQSAKALATETQDRFQSYLSLWMGKPVSLETEVSAALLGGVRVYSPDGLLDLSLRGKSQALKTYLLKNIKE
jgi:ATP synthase F1 delta subunit